MSKGATRLLRIYA